MHNVIAVIPAKNERQTVHAVVRGTVRHCPVIVVDDHSSDDTAATASKAGALIVELVESTGYGAALMRGFSEAMSMGCSHVISLDGDGAHDPDDIPAMIHQHLACNAALTLGNRFSNPTSTTIPSAKLWANHFATAVTNRVLGFSLEDVACGFRVLSRDILVALQQVKPVAGFEWVVQLLELTRRAGFDITTCPVQVHYDAAELHATSQRELLDAMMGIKSCLPESSACGSIFHQLMSSVALMEPVTLRVGNRVLCMHPVASSYVFQLHPAKLPEPRFGHLLDLDAALVPANMAS